MSIHYSTTLTMTVLLLGGPAFAAAENPDFTALKDELRGLARAGVELDKSVSAPPLSDALQDQARVLSRGPVEFCGGLERHPGSLGSPVAGKSAQVWGRVHQVN